MSTDVISIICLGSFFGGFVNGLTGFGTGLFALSWWLFVMSPSQAIFLVIAITTLWMEMVIALEANISTRHFLFQGLQLKIDTRLVYHSTSPI